MNILIVEDDVVTAKQLQEVLKQEKYNADIAFGYQEAQIAIDRYSYALILLDWNLGDGDGLTLLQEMREMEIMTPILMLSANSAIDDRVVVLDNGADDYLCKPYSNIELLARMRALLRRETEQKSLIITIADVKLDTKLKEVSVLGEQVELTPSEYDLLELFMQNPKQVLTRYQLSEHINKDNYSLRHSNLIDVHIKNLRKKLKNKDFIQNVRGVGYKLGV